MNISLHSFSFSKFSSSDLHFLHGFALALLLRHGDQTSRNGTLFPSGELWIRGKMPRLEVEFLTQGSLFTFFSNLSSRRDKALHFWHRILYPQLQRPWRLLIRCLLWFRITKSPTIRKSSKRCGISEVSRLATEFDIYQKPDCG